MWIHCDHTNWRYIFLYKFELQEYENMFYYENISKASFEQKIQYLHFKLSEEYGNCKKRSRKKG